MKFDVTKSTLVLLLGIFLTACAQTHWEKSGMTPAIMARDLDACRDLASIEAEKEYALNLFSLRNSPSDTAEADRARRMNLRAQKRLNQLTENCMRGRGYHKAKAKSRD